MRLAAHDRDDENLVKSCAEEGFGALMDRGPRGEHVIDEHRPGGRGLDAVTAMAGDFKSVQEVCHALLAGEVRLTIGLARPAQGPDHGQAGLIGKDACDFFRLIEVAVLHALAVEGHGHQRPAPIQCWIEARVVKRFLGEAPKFTGEVDLPAVFQMVDQLERAVVARECRASKREGK